MNQCTLGGQETPKQLEREQRPNARREIVYWPREKAREPLQLDLEAA